MYDPIMQKMGEKGKLYFRMLRRRAALCISGGKTVHFRQILPQGGAEVLQ